MYGVGYKLAPAVTAAADNADINYVIIDSVVGDKKNVICCFIVMKLLILQGYLTQNYEDKQS